MKHIGEMLQAPPEREKLPRSEYNYIVQQFLEGLNKERGDFKPVTVMQLTKHIKHITSANERSAFLKYCSHAKNFSKRFWWAIRPGKTVWSKPEKK